MDTDWMGSKDRRAALRLPKNVVCPQCGESNYVDGVLDSDD